MEWSGIPRHSTYMLHAFALAKEYAISKYPLLLDLCNLSSKSRGGWTAYCAEYRETFTAAETLEESMGANKQWPEWPDFKLRWVLLSCRSISYIMQMPCRRAAC